MAALALLWHYSLLLMLGYHVSLLLTLSFLADLRECHSLDVRHWKGLEVVLAELRELCK